MQAADMRACFFFVFLLAATFALSVKSKPHGKHHRPLETSHSAKGKDLITKEAYKAQLLPTLAAFEASNHEQQDGEMISEDNTNTENEDDEVTENKKKSSAVLLSEEELVDLLKKETEEEEEAKESEVEDEEAEAGMMENPTDNDGNKNVGMLEETEGSTESELPADPDYAADGELLQPLQTEPAADDTPSDQSQDLLDAKNEDDDEKTEAMQTSETGNTVGAPDQDKDSLTEKKSVSNEELEANDDPLVSKSLKSGLQMSQKEEKSKNESGTSTKRNTRKPKKNQRAKKDSPQRNETRSTQEPDQQDRQEPEDAGTENIAQKAKRGRAGKWGPLVGVNPVQIRASAELYPRSRSLLGGDIHLLKTQSDPCENFRCKRGKTCKLDTDGKPGCVCQQPSECPGRTNEFDQVCGTDNKTYDTSCELFAIKCNLEGTKKGHRLHLDYTGPCKLIPLCVSNELVQFPLRMRDWLKNVLLQLYEHDSASPGFLTAKQRFKVKKIFENERRLHAGDHPLELLAQDFEKNYNMYIYPVHWQFAQLDQHPSDRFLSHSELAPLRVPLVPMEHCTSRFFQECDADKDKQVSFKEWTSCFGIKDDDMDINLLF
ncbi:SPARC-like protein 1 [Nothobranchius furzeri]|uniref:SPARC-like 1 n=1 Tax=Nothobranchius furzeri TaxID=105023 RepID=A0A1A7ZWS4_NOTFU|nr:SPARC-like protein 1 [Nothobranchius furzeri]XP_054600783.1 SPARC-like protein 1 [Nothobranchius furzeri]XP_054600784.1 SPARC-like protein 1 [Nothobranchius furzeri]KAF7217895.1 transcript variant X1 [Nothobranchius furzeri]KAF7217896.1 transcript variant X2 [Nothobranchius furzeri]